MPFERDEDGLIVVAEAKEAPNTEAARPSPGRDPPHAGSLAFRRTGDPDIGEFQDGEVIAEFGEIDRGALQERSLVGAENLSMSDRVVQCRSRRQSSPPVAFLLQSPCCGGMYQVSIVFRQTSLVYIYFGVIRSSDAISIS